jgi:hypothetical protein
MQVSSLTLFSDPTRLFPRAGQSGQGKGAQRGAFCVAPCIRLRGFR